MKQAVYASTKTSGIEKGTESVHLVRPIKAKKLEELSRKGVKELCLSPSCEKRLSRKTKKLIEEKGITLKAEPSRGRAIEIPLEKVTEIAEMRWSDKTYREIEELTGVPKSTAHYLIKYANRNKLKKGKSTIYVEGGK
ncbi:MAG: hypothetical protein V1494_01490 [Candidatus Diapherotrites archaeon]